MVAELQRQLKELEGCSRNDAPTPIAPPRRQAPPKPSIEPSPVMKSHNQHLNEGAPLGNI